MAAIPPISMAMGMGSLNASRRSAPGYTTVVQRPQQSDILRIPASPPPPPTLYKRMLRFIRVRGQTSYAPRHARRNQAQCVFSQLPAELHAYIAEYLLETDLLSYAQCSQKTTWLVSHFQPPHAAKAVFTARLRRDQEIRRLARIGFDVQTVAWCSRHLKLHHIALFARNQLAESVTNDARVCVGVTGRFRGCEHQSFSIAELRREMFTFTPELCNKHLDVEEGILGIQVMRRRHGYGPVFANTHMIRRLPYYERVDAMTVQSLLRQRNVHICPHLSSADDCVLRVCTARDGSLCKRGNLANERQAFSKTGFCAYCLAEYTLYRREGGGSLLLDVRREVKDLYESPVSENVLVHLEDCGVVHCAYEEGSWHCKYAD